MAKTSRQIRKREAELLRQTKQRGVQSFARLTDIEVRALATCEYSKRSQKTVDKIIASHVEVIQTWWTEAERQRRKNGGEPHVPWEPAVVSMADLEREQDGEGEAGW